VLRSEFINSAFITEKPGDLKHGGRSSMPNSPSSLTVPSPAVGRTGSLLLNPIRRVLRSQLRVNIFSGFATTVINLLALAVSYPLYLYFLGYEKVGVWLLLSSVQVFAQLGLLGIGPALTKLVAEERGRGDSAGAQQYVSLSTTVLLATGALACLALWIFDAAVVSGLGLQGADAVIALKLLPYVGLLTAFSFINQVTTATLAGVGRMDVANYCVTGGKIGALGLEIFLLWRGWGIVTLLLGDFVGCAVIHFAGLVYLRRDGLRMLRGNPWNRARFSRLTSFGGTMFVISLTTLLVAPLNKLGLSRYGHIALIPVYEIAFTGSMHLRGLAEVGLRALMPEVSTRGAVGTQEAWLSVKSLHGRALKLLLGVMPFAYILAILLAKPMLSLWLRDRFRSELVPTFDILLGSAMVSLISVPAYYTLMGTGHVRSCLVSHLLAAVTNIIWVVVALIVTGTFSLTAASVAVLVSTSVSSGYLLLRSHRLLSSRAAPRKEMV
jgi:O-antigen/teichoic acid export membrane protein